MPRNGSGTYTRVAGTPYVYNTVISETTVNSEMDDIATAITGSIAKDGQTTPTANLPMGTYRHTGVGNGSARTDYAAMGQVQDGKVNWVDGGGTADAITATYSPVITALVDGQLCFVRATAANATTTPTFAPNGLTARTIVKKGGAALVAGDIVADGHELILRYDLTNTRWELLNPGAYAASGAATSSGLTMATSRLLGRTTASTGAIEEISVSSAISLTGGTLGLNVGTTTRTPIATTSGSSQTHSSLPTGIKKITVTIGGVSSNGTAVIGIQLGDSGGLEPTGYAGCVNNFNGSTLSSLGTGGFFLSTSGAAAQILEGSMELTLVDSSTNTWSATWIMSRSDGTTGIYTGSGTKSLTGTLDRVAIVTTDTLDAGKFGLTYTV